MQKESLTQSRADDRIRLTMDGEQPTGYFPSAITNLFCSSS